MNEAKKIKGRSHMSALHASWIVRLVFEKVFIFKVTS